MYITKTKELVAIQMGNKPRMRIVYNEKTDMFYLQQKQLFLWIWVECTCSMEVVRVWRGSYMMAWVSDRWKY
jgi:hypothetical protein